LRIAKHGVGDEYVVARQPNGREQSLEILSGLIPVKRDAAAFRTQTPWSFRDEERSRVQRAIPRPEHSASPAHPRARVASVRGALECAKCSFLLRDCHRIKLSMLGN
jgi:hypothetical protein